MFEAPKDLAPPWDALARRTSARLAGFGQSVTMPAPSRDAISVGDAVVQTGPAMEVETATFSTFGFQNFSQEQHEFSSIGYPPLRPSFDHALYKTRTGAGVFSEYLNFSLGTQSVSLGTSTAVYELDPAGIWVSSRSPTSPDTVSLSSKPGETVQGFFAPRFRGAFGGFGFDTPWQATASTFANHYGAGNFPPFSGTITLSDPCTWADLEAQSARVLSEGFSTGASPSWGSAIASSSGSGATDGTRWMAKQVARFRFSARPYRQKIVWAEVTRQNNAGVHLGPSDSGFMPTQTRARRELTEPLDRPYFDEWGAWSPTDLRWSDAGERLLRWAYASWLQRTLFLYGRSFADTEAGYDPRIMATRFRVLVDSTESGLTARVTLSINSGSEVLDLPVTSGETETVERVATANPNNTTHFCRIISVTVWRGTNEVPEIASNIVFRQRRALRIAGHAALDGSDTFMVPRRYRVETRTMEYGLAATLTNGAQFDSGQSFQVAVTGEARLSVVREYHPTTGAAKWDASAFREGEVIERSGSFNGLAWVPPWQLSLNGPPTTSTATVLERVAALAETPQLAQPIDANGLNAEGAILASIERSETIDAGATGEWHTLDCAVRGAGVFIEDLQAVRL